MIEYAKFSHAGINSLRIKINERSPVGAIEVKGSDLMFDRTGELVEIRKSAINSAYSKVIGVPPGLLKINGRPIYADGGAWGIQKAAENEDNLTAAISFFENQFERTIRLVSFVELYGKDTVAPYYRVTMDERGMLLLTGDKYPAIYFGKFDNPEEQYRRAAAVVEAMSDGLVEPGIKVADILLVDLSSIEYPFFKLANSRNTPNIQAEPARNDSASDVSLIADTLDNSGDVEHNAGAVTNPPREFNTSIFSLTGKSDDD